MNFTGKPSIWYWVICVLGLLWFGIGAMDYVMVNFKVADYMANYTAPDLAFLDARPMWFTAAWAISIWSSVLGIVLLFLRRPLAVQMFGVSLLGYVVSGVWTFGVADVSSSNFHSIQGYIFSVLILVSIVFFWWYSIRQRGKAVLR